MPVNFCGLTSSECYYLCVVAGLLSADLNSEHFGRRFNQQPIAIFDVPEPSDTGKSLAEFYLDMHHLGQRGIYLEI